MDDDFSDDVMSAGKSVAGISMAIVFMIFFIIFLILMLLSFSGGSIIMGIIFAMLTGAMFYGIKYGMSIM